MELLQGLDIIWRLILAMLFVMLPGTVFWLAVLGLWALIRRLVHSRPIQNLRDRTQLLPTEKGAEP
ncbi:MAG: hypothetical protein PVF47_00690 [Anaerolineae bacterium]|jgi:hypothetical protein